MSRQSGAAVTSGIRGLHHVQLAAPVGSEERVRWFYGTVLGLPEVAKPPVLAARGGAEPGAGVELLLGAVLVACCRPRTTLVLAAILWGGFTAWTAFHWWRGTPGGCGCGLRFGRLNDFSGGSALLRNAAISAWIALAITLELRRDRRRALYPEGGSVS